MSRPKITENLSGFVYEWADEQIKIEASRIKSHSDGTVKGEITVSTTMPGTPSHLHQAQFNFSSTQSRKSLSKGLEERARNIDWYAILEQLSVYTLERVRRGEPVEEISSEDEVAPPMFLLEPLILKGHPNVIYGEKGTGKSTVGAIVAACLSLPWYDNYLGLRTPLEPCSVLLLDWEQSKAIVTWSLGMISKGMELGPVSIHYRRCAMPFTDDLEQIQKDISEYNPDLIIVDSLGPACGGELNKAEIAIAFSNAIRKINRTFLLIGQTSKNEEGGKSIFGSVFFTYLARNIWRIDATKDEDSIDIGLFHEWGNYTKKLKPIGFHIDWNEGLMKIRAGDPKTVPEFMERISATVRIIEALKQGGLTPKELQTQCGLSDVAVRVAIHRLKDKVVKLSDGKIGLAANV